MSTRVSHCARLAARGALRRHATQRLLSVLISLTPRQEYEMTSENNWGDWPEPDPERSNDRVLVTVLLDLSGSMNTTLEDDDPSRDARITTRIAALEDGLQRLVSPAERRVRPRLLPESPLRWTCRLVSVPKRTRNQRAILLRRGYYRTTRATDTSWPDATR